jgi:heterodisulfide reductase subunit A
MDERAAGAPAADELHPRVGAFICHCGNNIAGFLDVQEVTEYAKTLPHVVWAQDSMYTCSDGGRSEIAHAIAEHNLNRVVVASCTPRTHEPLFRATCEEAGLNRYLFELVNIRDQCSWVHMQDRERATEKAKDLLRSGVARAALLQPQENIEVGVVPAALVIGAGIAGLSATLNLANRGFKVYLVEREAEMGGLLRGAHRVYPTGDDARGFVETRVRAVRNHPNVEVLTNAEVSDVKGFVGNYHVVVKPGDASPVDLNVGTIIVATGARVFRPDGLYGYRSTSSVSAERVITMRELDRLLEQRMGSLGPRVRSVVMIQCVGSRNEERPYCSRICCMTAVRNAMWIVEANPGTRVYVLYRDMLTLGTIYEDLYREARGKGVIFVQYDPESPPVVEKQAASGAEAGLHVIVRDRLLGQEISIPCDLVALSTPLIGQEGATELAQLLKVPVNEHGFFLEAHVKLRPLDFATDGIYLCGSARFPSNVGESISQAQGAAGRASILLGKGTVEVEPIVSLVDEELCIGCGLCEKACPYNAITLYDTGAGRKARTISASCKGCGVCGAGCPALAISMQHFSNEQLYAQVDALLPADSIVLQGEGMTI